MAQPAQNAAARPAISPSLSSDGSAMWDQAAGWWTEHLPQDKNRRLQVFPTLLELLGDVHGRRILDAGCGEGSFARLLAAHGAQVCGVDFSRIIESAVAEELREPRGIRYLRTDIARLPGLALGRGFDHIVCNLMLHCCSDIAPILDALHSQLRPGGSMVVADLHPETFGEYSQAWTRCVPIGTGEYRYTLSPNCPELVLHLHSLPALERAFAQSGFICEKRQCPPALSSRHIRPGHPQFVYYLLRKLPLSE
jgi:2-polyprenyl-3-methyl-5-hydroxy-6-metoxy-1,4-benzoquinol methylase